MSCGFCISADTAGGYQDYRCGFDIAQQDTTCCECSQPIKAGARYEWASGYWYGEKSTHQTCVVCADIAELCCDRSHGSLWDGLASALEEAEEPITTACFSKMKTAAGKKAFQEFWIDFVGLNRL